MDTDLRKCITGTGPEPESRKADIPTAIRNFEKNRFTVKHFATKEEAADYLSEEIRGKTVGFGDSATLAAMKIAEKLSEHNLVIDPASHPDDIFMLTAKGAMDTQVFLLSVNAASETGELVNIDSSGNRVGGSLFGHEKIYYVFSVNKIEPTLERAIWRVRNIAAPRNAKRFGFKTPCAIKGDSCYDCSSPDRICNKLEICMKKGKVMEEEIILIDETLGY